MGLFRALRLHVVQVSTDFGARLGVRLRALSSADESPEPNVLEVFMGTVLAVTEIMLAPLHNRAISIPAKPKAPAPPDRTASGSKEDNDG